MVKQHWAHSVTRMSFVKKRATTTKSKHSVAISAEFKQSFFNDPT